MTYKKQDLSERQFREWGELKLLCPTMEPGEWFKKLDQLTRKQAMENALAYPEYYLALYNSSWL